MIMTTIRFTTTKIMVPMMIVMVVVMTKTSTPIPQDCVTATTMIDTQWNPKKVVQ